MKEVLTKVKSAFTRWVLCCLVLCCAVPESPVPSGRVQALNPDVCVAVCCQNPDSIHMRLASVRQGRCGKGELGPEGARACQFMTPDVCAADFFSVHASASRCFKILRRGNGGNGKPDPSPWTRVQSRKGHTANPYVCASALHYPGIIPSYYKGVLGQWKAHSPLDLRAVTCGTHCKPTCNVCASALIFVSRTLNQTDLNPHVPCCQTLT